MPVKIVSGTTTTNRVAGLITEDDLQTMKDSFIDEVNLTPVNGRTRIIKKYGCYLKKAQLLALFDAHSDADVVNINLAVHLPGTVACDARNFEDHLTVIIEAAKQGSDRGNYISYNSLNDFVVIPTFKSDSVRFIALDDDCCPYENP